VTSPLIIYHANCVDGWTAAWVAYRHADPELHAAHYGDASPDVRERSVFVVDFSYPRETLIDMYEKSLSLRVLDHHSTAAADLEGLPFCTFDMERSGAGLAWDILETGPRPWLVDYVEDRDLWRWALPNSRAVSAYIATQPFTIEAWDALAALRVEDVVERGRAVLSYVERRVESMVERAARGWLSHQVDADTLAYEPCAVVNCTGEMSEVGNTLASKHPFAALWFQNAEGEYIYSLRSDASNPEHVDVSVIAKLFGGGGHKHAAGFKVRAPVHTRSR